METVRAGDGAELRAAGFRHEALFYAGPARFVEGAARFVRESLAADEPIMVAVLAGKAELLREELGADAGRVSFVDMGTVGRNPARIIPMWQSWVDRHAPAGRRVRGIGEPIWAGRTPAEIVECEQHEALINTAFDDGPPWWLLCPYDTSCLDRGVIERACQTHPWLLHGRESRASLSYPHPRLSPPAMLADPLPEPEAAAAQFAFTLDELAEVRRAVADHAGRVGLSAARAEELVLAVSELAANSVVHGGGTGVLRLWSDGRVLTCEVRDRGLIRDPLVGRRRPPVTAAGGAGLWMTNQLCDLVQIRSTPAAGTTVRAHVVLAAA